MGVAAGVALALLVTCLLEKLPFGVKPYDPASFIAVAAGLSAVALVSVYLSPGRAMGLDRLIALRRE